MKFLTKTLFVIGTLALSGYTNADSNAKLPANIVPYQIKYTLCERETIKGEAVPCARIDYSGFKQTYEKDRYTGLSGVLEGNTRFSDSFQSSISENGKESSELYQAFSNSLNYHKSKSTTRGKRYYIIDRVIKYKVLDSFDNSIVFLLSEKEKAESPKFSDETLVPVKIGEKVEKYEIYDYFIPSKAEMDRIFEKEWLISNCLIKNNKSSKDNQAVERCESKANKKLSRPYRKVEHLVGFFVLNREHGLAPLLGEPYYLKDSIFYPNSFEKQIIFPYKRIEAYLKPEIKAILSKNKNYKFAEYMSEWD